MRLNNLFGLLAACAAGFLGGILASQDRVQAFAPQVVRASRFELINRAGVLVASWDMDPANNIRLRFFSKPNVAAEEIGVLSNGQPFLRMAGRDGRNRVAIELGERDKPLLTMSDDQWEGRIHLGFIFPDTSPFPSDSDEWGLLFRAIGSQRAIAAIGKTKATDGSQEGFLTVSGQRIR